MATTTAQIKCFVCRKRTNIEQIQQGMTCSTCTNFLTKYGHQYQNGETVDQYRIRLEEVLDMKVGA
jgi:hypothetical protein